MEGWTVDGLSKISSRHILCQIVKCICLKLQIYLSQIGKIYLSQIGEFYMECWLVDSLSRISSRPSVSQIARCIYLELQNVLVSNWGVLNGMLAGRQPLQDFIKTDCVSGRGPKS